MYIYCAKTKKLRLFFVMKPTVLLLTFALGLVASACMKPSCGNTRSMAKKKFRAYNSIQYR